MPPTPAPQNASAAPPADGNTTYDGLCEALNSFQKKLVDDEKYEKPDIYSIEFVPPELGQALLKSPGSIPDDNNVGMCRPEQATQPNAQAVDPNSVTQNPHSGMQITQFINQIMRNSTYITEQTTYQVDQLSGNTLVGPGSNKKPTWYKINFNATPYAYDYKRNDFAYNINYVISFFNIVDMKSPYFKTAFYRGVHKSYDYWFTGLNKSIISFEQNLNKQWYYVTSGFKVPSLIQQSDSYELQKVVYQPRSDVSSAGRQGATNEPQANGANYLMNPTDMHQATVRIVGDPAWLQQGEAAGGLNGTNFSLNAFNSDGTINFDASQICFRINWNAPQDYDLEQGIMPVGRKDNAIPKEYLSSWESNKQADVSTVYIAIGCRSIFSKGTFTQELKGVLFQEPSRTFQQNGNTQIAQSSASTQATNTPPILSQDATSVQNGVNAQGQNVGLIVRDETGAISNLQQNPEDGSLYDPTGKQLIIHET